MIDHDELKARKNTTQLKVHAMSTRDDITGQAAGEAVVVAAAAVVVVVVVLVNPYACLFSCVTNPCLFFQEGAEEVWDLLAPLVLWMPELEQMLHHQPPLHLQPHDWFLNCPYQRLLCQLLWSWSWS
jgi:hypothetical protein